MGSSSEIPNLKTVFINPNIFFMKNQFLIMLLAVALTLVAFTDPKSEKFDDPKYNEAKIEYAEMATNGWNHVVDVEDVEAWKEYTFSIYTEANVKYTSSDYEFRYHEGLNKWYMSVTSVEKATSDYNFENAPPNCDYICGEANCPPGTCCVGWWLTYNIAGLGGCVYSCVEDIE